MVGVCTGHILIGFLVEEREREGGEGRTASDAANGVIHLG